MKIRVDSKDIVIFIMFSILLLYFVAIGVLNISSFASDGVLYGLNPIEAFTGEYLAPTMVVFLSCVNRNYVAFFITYFPKRKWFWNNN